MNLVTNIDSVINVVDARMSRIQVDEMTRIQATTLMAKIRNRVHRDGIATDGASIGTYSSRYARYTRPKYGRGTSTAVVASLTRAMENSMVLYPLDNGTGIGYATEEQMQKARWVENTYDKRIFLPTDEERELAIQIAKDYIAERL